MTRRTRKTKNRMPDSERRIESPSIPLLKQLVQLNKQQTIRESPNVPDAIMPAIKRNKIYTFTRSADLGTITPSTTLEVDSVFTFTLASLPDSTDFTNLFDAYRITGVRVTFQPLFVDTAATVVYPPLHSAIDYDDANATSQSLLAEYDSLLVVQSGTYFERTLVPRIAVAAYGAGVFTSYAQRSKQWIDAASPSVAHYGLKTSIAAAGAANAVWQVTAHYFLECRQSR